VDIDTVVIGAGWAGLTAARALVKGGREVVVLEKSRGPGGRSATRRADGARFDHGAQYFTVRGARFGRHLQQWRDAGLVQPWRPRLAVIGERPARTETGETRAEDTNRFVCVPGMNGVCRYMAADLDCRFEQRVNRLAFERHWRLALDSGESLRARRLLITAPPAQAAELLGEDDRLYDQLAAVAFQPCITGMLAFNKPLDPGFDAAFVNQPGALSWVACNSSKPERTGNNWVLHADGQWSDDNLGAPLECLAERLAEAFAELIGERLSKPLPGTSLQLAHRWRYSQAAQALDQELISQAAQALDQELIADSERRLAIAGDWLAGSRIEGAWTSGRKAGEWLAGLS